MFFKDPPYPIIDTSLPSVKNDIDKYIESNGRNNVVNTQIYLPIKFCLLTTRGRISNQWSRVALFYIEHNDVIYFVASNNGGIKQPGWYKNMLEYPLAWIEINGDSYWTICRELHPEIDSDLRAQIWSKACGIFPTYKGFQEKVPQRIFPIVAIKRI